MGTFRIRYVFTFLNIVWAEISGLRAIGEEGTLNWELVFSYLRNEFKPE